MHINNCNYVVDILVTSEYIGIGNQNVIYGMNSRYIYHKILSHSFGNDNINCRMYCSSICIGIGDGNIECI